MKFLFTFKTSWGLAAIEVSKENKPLRIILPPAKIDKEVIFVKPDDRLKRWRAFLQDYFDGVFKEPPKLDELLPTGFSLSVYSALQKITAGKVISYSELAALSGNRKAYRAVGQALAKNPFPIVVPCHRVIRLDGSLGGFSGAGGTDYKKRLLLHEGAMI